MYAISLKKHAPTHSIFACMYARSLLYNFATRPKPRNLFNEMLLETNPRNLSTAKFKRYTVLLHLFGRCLQFERAHEPVSICELRLTALCDHALDCGIKLPNWSICLKVVSTFFVPVSEHSSCIWYSGKRVNRYGQNIYEQ